MTDALLEMALRSQTDPAAISVLGDMLIEAGRDRGMLRTWVMALLIGVPLDGEIPPKIRLKGEAAHQNFRKQRAASLEVAASYWPQYAFSCSPTWARAVLAVLLFGSWRPTTTSTGGDFLDRTCSPWPVVRRRGVRSANEIRRHREELLERLPKSEARAIARTLRPTPSRGEGEP